MLTMLSVCIALLNSNQNTISYFLILKVQLGGLQRLVVFSLTPPTDAATTSKHTVQPRCAQVWLTLICYANNLFTYFQSGRGRLESLLSEHDGFPPTSSCFLQTTFAVNHGQRVIYWHRWHFSVCTLPPLHRRRRCLPVHPSHLLILSINASRQAGRHRVISPHAPPLHHLSPSSALPLQHPHPSIPLHHSQLKGAAWVPLICSLWICRRLLSVCEL